MKAKVFWLFSVTFQVDLTIVRKQNIWSASADSLVGGSSFLRGCTEVYKDKKGCHERYCYFYGWKPMDESQSASSSANTGTVYSWESSTYYKSWGPTVFRAWGWTDTMQMSYPGGRRRRRVQNTRRRTVNRAMVLGSPSETDLQLIFYSCR